MPNDIVATVERAVAPDVVVIKGYVDRRAAVVADLDRRFPEFVHSYQSAKVEAHELASNEQEIVTGATIGLKGADKDKPVSYRGDIVVRATAASWRQQRAEGEEHSYRRVQETLGSKKNEERANMPDLRRTPKPRSRDEIKKR